MTIPISDWRFARSQIGAVGAAEDVELDFNLSTKEAIEVASIAGHLAFGTLTSGSTILTRIAQQSVRINEGTIEVLSLDETDNDTFDNDSNVAFEQFLNGIAFDGTTEGGAAIDGVNYERVFNKPFVSPINLTHSVINEGSTSAVTAVVIIEYRFVELTQSELAFQFARRRR